MREKPEKPRTPPPIPTLEEALRKEDERKRARRTPQAPAHREPPPVPRAPRNAPPIPKKKVVDEAEVSAKLKSDIRIAMEAASRGLAADAAESSEEDRRIVKGMGERLGSEAELLRARKQRIDEAVARASEPQDVKSDVHGDSLVHARVRNRPKKDSTARAPRELSEDAVRIGRNAARAAEEMLAEGVTDDEKERAALAEESDVVMATERRARQAKREFSIDERDESAQATFFGGRPDFLDELQREHPETLPEGARRDRAMNADVDSKPIETAPLQPEDPLEDDPERGMAPKELAGTRVRAAAEKVVRGIKRGYKKGKEILTNPDEAKDVRALPQHTRDTIQRIRNYDQPAQRQERHRMHIEKLRNAAQEESAKIRTEAEQAGLTERLFGPVLKRMDALEKRLQNLSIDTRTKISLLVVGGCIGLAAGFTGYLEAKGHPAPAFMWKWFSPLLTGLAAVGVTNLEMKEKGYGAGARQAGISAAWLGTMVITYYASSAAQGLFKS